MSSVRSTIVCLVQFFSSNILDCTSTNSDGVSLQKLNVVVVMDHSNATYMSVCVLCGWIQCFFCICSWLFTKHMNLSLPAADSGPNFVLVLLCLLCQTSGASVPNVDDPEAFPALA